MIYAIRELNGRKTLVEKKCDPSAHYQRVPIKIAKQWVIDGKEHETGLWIDEGKVRYAEST